MSEALDKAFNEPTGKIQESRQRLAGLEQNTQQRCLAMKTDVKTNTKTRKRAEDAAAGQANHGDSCFAKRVQVSPTSSSSFGMKAELPALLRRGEILVKKDAAVPSRALRPWRDAQTNSRRELASRRHSLYSNDNHFFPTASFVDTR